ncbi:ABC transporter ATP-binding protein [Acinetobacter qingfengensis]|uniref:Microcin ABC transporter ATP-binding protein n=1 Tax=Acinetobacter qingfengensis TaxID=1262585 RepID=A0A1E7R834_9GAMM|nr:dipeptide ABC transporter ATP-binding protein [Acinetobacter qingfengensis]KAA8731426.1 ABC transporter ATP-binding protein [Acinetobacter qingfengensis]OEY95514.1 microcin ABC transporter ATP-binding protein [Acinetobacter qingfengensis]
MHLTQNDKHTPLLDVQHLSITTEQQTLLQNLSFRLYAGQTLALVGESGSGKSITSLAILGLLPDQLKISGQVKFVGRDLLQCNVQELTQIRGKKIAMIFQEPMTALNPLHRVEHLIGETLRLNGMSKAAVRQKVLDLLQDVGLSDAEEKLKRYPHQLSGGQRQRVMIAMALAQEPDVLIADEPTTALDVNLQVQILDLLKTLQQQRQMAMLLISHDLNLVRRYADQVMVLQQGQLIEQGDIARVFAHPEQDYTRLLLNQDFGQALAYRPDALALLELQDLQVRFPIKSGIFNRTHAYFTALHPLSLTLQQGQSIGIVGESGSGKSTLALAVTRLIESTGQIQLNDIRLDQYNEKQLRPYRQYIQIVFQDPLSSLNPRLNVAQLIGEGLQLQGLSKLQIQQKVLQTLTQVELPEAFAQRYPHQLSGGQRQRVALARALILQPKVIILDEPTSALDRSTQQSIVKLLRDLQQKFQLSYLFISHDLAVVRALCQHILVLHHGQVMEFQRTEQLFEQPKTAYTQALLDASLL